MCIIKCMMLCWFCLVFVAYNAVATNNKIQFNITAYGESLYCDQNQTTLKEYRTTVLENEPTELEPIYQTDLLNSANKKSLYVNNITCVKEKLPKNETITISGAGHKSISIGNIYKKMDRILDCQILTHQGANIKPIVVINNRQYTSVICNIQLHVRLSEPPQLILVNRIELPITQVSLSDPEQRYDHIAVYNYSSGDEVDVLCLDESNKCNNIEMSYDYAERLENDMFNKTWQSKLGVGFRTKLQAHHNGTSMVCKCIESEDETIVKVTFTLKNIDDIDAFKLNGSTVRRSLSLTGLKFQEYRVQYRTLVGEYVDIECVSNFYNTNIEKTEKCEKQTSKNNFMVKPKHHDDTCKVHCTLSHKNGTVDKRFIVEISNLLNIFRDDMHLAVNFSKNINNIMEMYQYNNESWIYYEYQDGDNVTITCSKRVPRGPRTHIISNGTEIRDKSSFSTDIQLSSAYNNTEFYCKLIERENAKNVITQRVIHVKFYLRKDPETTTISTSTSTSTSVSTSPTVVVGDSVTSESGLSESTLIWIGCAVLCIVLICVSTIICKMRKKRPQKDQNTPIYENFTNDRSDNGSAIPPYPAQWSQENPYQVPADQRNTNDNAIYSVPVQQEDPYATPVPKHLRPGKKQDMPEPTYASLELPTDTGSHYSVPEQSPYATVGELYSQVTPKNARNRGYDNVFPNSRYVNSQNTEYVEPTYSEAHFK